MTTEPRYRVVRNILGSGDRMTPPRPHVVLDLETKLGSRVRSGDVASTIADHLNAGKTTPRMYVWEKAAGEVALRELDFRERQSRAFGIGDGPHMHFEAVRPFAPGGGPSAHMRLGSWNPELARTVFSAEPPAVPPFPATYGVKVPGPFEFTDDDGDTLKLEDDTHEGRPVVHVGFEDRNGEEAFGAHLTAEKARKVADCLHEFAEWIEAEEKRRMTSGRIRVVDAGELGEQGGFKVPPTPVAVDLETGGVRPAASKVGALRYALGGAPIPAKAGPLERSIFPPVLLGALAERRRQRRRPCAAREVRKEWVEMAPAVRKAFREDVGRFGFEKEG
jgi:hypothetical protein